MQKWRLELYTHASAIWQYRWFGLATAWTICVLGWIAVAAIPNTYQSVAQVYIDTNTLLRPLLKGLAVEIDPNQEIQVMLQTLLTDPTLERVLRASDPKAAALSSNEMQDAITSFRKRISLTNLTAKDLYSIAYSDRDPAHAQAVAQTLVSVLIDSSLGGQRRDADQVGSFFDSQIASYEQKLEAADKRRADFKAAHLDFFSSTAAGDKVSGAGDVVGAQAAVTQAQNMLKEANDRRNSLRAQLKATPKTLDVNSPLPASMDHSATALTGRSQLAEAIAKLNMLRTRFTDSYPDVVAQKRLIERLKATVTGAKSDDNSQGISNPSFVMLMSKLADAETEVVVDRSRLQDAQKRLEAAKGMAEKAITVQREYENLDRDSQVFHQNYEALVTRRESAKITQAAGDQQSAFVFRVISPPLKPNRPHTPNRLLFNGAVLILGLGAGVGVAFALGQFSGTFMSVEQLKDAFDLPVLGTITYAPSAGDAAVARMSTTVFGTALGLLFVTSTIVLYFFHGGMGVGAGPTL